MRLLLSIALAGGLALNEGATRDVTTRRDLKSVTEIQGYSCAAGYAWFFTDGTLASCFVSRASAFGGIEVPAKSWIQLTRDGRPRFVFLAQDAAVNGFRCRGGGHDFSTALYPTGELRTCWLAEDSVVDGVPCMRAGFIADVFGGGVEVDFHSNGRLRRCKVSREFRYGGRVFAKGDHIVLDENGSM
jgi:hypothetical protein